MKLLKLTVLLTFSCLYSCVYKSTSANIDSVFVKNGNVFCKGDENKIKQLTFTGIDTMAVLSPDKKMIAFVRKNPGIYDEANEMLLIDNSEIWLYDIISNKNRCIVKPVNFEEGITPENILTNFQNLVFTNDGQKLLFITSAWETSGAIHEFSIQDNKQKYLVSGNSLEIITQGKYKDYLIINQHRYYEAGGSYDYYWLFDNNGKEIREIGDTEASVQNFLSEFNSIY